MSEFTTAELEAIEARFWSKVDRRGGPASCWTWEAARNSDGYGAFSVGRGPRRRIARAHRFVLELEHGRPLPAAAVVMHSCDRRECVNPAHLMVGTPANNVADCVAKGRNAYGDRVAKKLTSAAVVEIRARLVAGETQRSIAEAFSVSQSLISQIKHARKWRHSGK